VVFPEALSEAAAKDQMFVGGRFGLSRTGTRRRKVETLGPERADLSVEAVELHASVGVTDTANAAPTTPGDLALDELRRALDVAASKALERCGKNWAGAPVMLRPEPSSKDFGNKRFRFAVTSRIEPTLNIEIFDHRSRSMYRAVNHNLAVTCFEGVVNHSATKP
jgi:hypothetical protein